MRTSPLILILSLVVSACAPAHRASRAESPAARLLTTLDARGLPGDAWSEADLNAYEIDLTRLERMDGGRHRPNVAKRRESLDNVRAKRVAKALSTAHQGDKAAKAAALMREREELVREINAGGKPEAAWPTARLRALDAKVMRVDELGGEIQSTLGRCLIDYDEFIREVRGQLDKAWAARQTYVSPLRQLNGSHLN